VCRELQAIPSGSRAPALGDTPHRTVSRCIKGFFLETALSPKRGVRYILNSISMVAFKALWCVLFHRSYWVYTTPHIPVGLTTEALHCANCGRKWREAKPGKLGLRLFLFAGTLLVLFVMGAMAFYTFRREAPFKNHAVGAAQQAVRQRLGPGIAIKFSPADWTRFETLPDDKFLVSGWIQAVDQSGRSISFTYSCKLFAYQDSWAVESLDLLEQ